jgi:hypothetical protein
MSSTSEESKHGASDTVISSDFKKGAGAAREGPPPLIFGGRNPANYSERSTGGASSRRKNFLGSDPTFTLTLRICVT